MATPPSFPPKIQFGSLAIYPQKPHNTQRQRDAAAFIVSGVKRDAVMRTQPPRSHIDVAITRLVDILPGSPLEAFFDPAAALVPMPGSALSRANSVSAPRSIAKALRDAGLGARVLNCLLRVSAIPKSAFCAPGERPDASQHRDSMRVEMPMHEQVPPAVLLVDDVLTRGATAMGAAARILQAFPGVTVKLFALARTDPMGDQFYDPLVGTITIQANGWQLRRHNYVIKDACGGGGLPF